MMVLEREGGHVARHQCNANNNAQWQWPMPRNIEKRRGCSIMHSGELSAHGRS